MPITIDEMIDSRRSGSGPDPFAELRYLVIGTEDAVQARNLVAATSSIYYDMFGVGLLLIRKEIIIEPGAVNDHWIGTVVYGGALAPDVTGPEQGKASFDTGGGTQKITHSLQTVAKHTVAGFPQLNFARAINVNEDNSVDGVEIVVPHFVFQETYALPNTFVTPSYFDVLGNLSGTVNVGSFRGFAAGEVLFLGAAGSERGIEGWELTYRFAVSRNKTGLTVGDPALGADWQITGIAKKGWEYLWVYYQSGLAESSHRIQSRPRAVFVERVYNETNFALLGIGA